MLRSVLIITGLLLLTFHEYVQHLSAQFQFIIFLAGILLLGIPHGAADYLVANQNSGIANKPLSNLWFFVNYLGRLLTFGLVLWFFPLIGTLLFIIFAAYHFGETDLYHFNTNTFSGKMVVISYGITILGVILLNHLEEVKPLIQLLDASVNKDIFLQWLARHRFAILSFFCLLFFASSFFYFSIHQEAQHSHGNFLVQFGLIIIILFNLPMVLGFTFYFIVWHSLLSLRNIIKYLRKNNLVSARIIAKQISLYSILAIAGMVASGFIGFLFINKNSITLCIFLGLAVLTAPHMQIMHQMYNNIRTNNSRSN